jgi:ABC-type multidrug transport system permease subunit
MGNARGQYIWLVGAICIALGAAYFNVLPALGQFLRGSPSALFALIPLVGLGLAISTFIARSRL